MIGCTAGTGKKLRKLTKGTLPGKATLPSSETVAPSPPTLESLISHFAVGRICCHFCADVTVTIIMLIPVHRATLPAALGSTSCTPPTSPERGVLSAVIGQDIQHQHTLGLCAGRPFSSSASLLPVEWKGPKKRLLPGRGRLEKSSSVSPPSLPSLKEVFPR